MTSSSVPAPPRSAPLSVVAVVGSTHRPSKTAVLVEAILDELAAVLPVDTHVVRLEEIGPQLAGALHRGQLPAAVESELTRIEHADLLVVATPVYRASFTGLFKHLFDLIGQYTLVDTPVLLAATGGTERHSLMLDHAMRPLFSYLHAVPLPTGVYAATADFGGEESGRLGERIARAVSELSAALREARATAAPAERVVPFEELMKGLGR